MRPARRIALSALGLALALPLVSSWQGGAPNLPASGPAAAARPVQPSQPQALHSVRAQAPVRLERARAGRGGRAGPVMGDVLLEVSAASSRPIREFPDPGSSALRAGDPRAPGVALLAPATPEALLRIHPAEATGELVIAGVDGGVFARFALARHFDPARRVFDLSVALPAGEDRVLLAHERPDGRRSPWCQVDLTGSPGGSCENTAGGMP